MKTVSTVTTMTLDGGTPCLDFINSGYDRVPGVVVERLHTYGDLLSLAARLELFNKTTLTRLRREARENTAAAATALQHAVHAREVLYKLFADAQEKKEGLTNASLLEDVNKLFAAALPYRVLVKEENGFIFRPMVETAGLMAPAWKLVILAYELAESGGLAFVRQCDGCGWLFYDNTKNHRRRWCSMESCGNEHKTKRYYQRKKHV